MACSIGLIPEADLTRKTKRRSNIDPRVSSDGTRTGEFNPDDGEPPLPEEQWLSSADIGVCNVA